MNRRIESLSTLASSVVAPGDRLQPSLPVEAAGAAFPRMADVPYSRRSSSRPAAKIEREAASSSRVPMAVHAPQIK